MYLLGGYTGNNLLVQSPGMGPSKYQIPVKVQKVRSHSTVKELKGEDYTFTRKRKVREIKNHGKQAFFPSSDITENAGALELVGNLQYSTLSK